MKIMNNRPLLLGLLVMVVMFEVWYSSYRADLDFSMLFSYPHHTSGFEVHVFATSSYLEFLMNYICHLQRLSLKQIYISTPDEHLIEKIEEIRSDFNIDIIFDDFSSSGTRRVEEAVKKKVTSGKAYRHLIEQKSRMIELLLRDRKEFLFSDADVAWRDASIVQVLQNTSWCDITWMLDERDKLSLCMLNLTYYDQESISTILEAPEPMRLDPVSAGYLLEQNKTQLDRGYRYCPSYWNHYPSDAVLYKKGLHAKKFPEPKDMAQYSKRNGQPYVHINMGFLFVRSNPRTRDFFHRLAGLQEALHLEQEQDAVYHLLTSEDAPHHRYMHPLDQSLANSLSTDVLRICLLPQHLYTNGFVLFRAPYSLDYFDAFAANQSIQYGCPCNNIKQGLKRPFSLFNTTIPSIIHFNGLSPQGKKAACKHMGLWVLEKNVCSRMHPTFSKIDPKSEVILSEFKLEEKEIMFA